MSKRKEHHPDTDRLRQALETLFPGKLYWNYRALPEGNQFLIEIDWWRRVEQGAGSRGIQLHTHSDQTFNRGKPIVEKLAELGIDAELVEGFQGTARLQIDMAQADFAAKLERLETAAKNFVPEKLPTVCFVHPPAGPNCFTTQHAADVLYLRFLDHDVVDPTSYEHLQAARNDPTYIGKLVTQSDMLAYLPFGNGSVAAGIAPCVELMLAKGGKVYEIGVNNEGRATGRLQEVTQPFDRTRILTPEETKTYAAAYQRIRGY